MLIESHDETPTPDTHSEAYMNVQTEIGDKISAIK